MVTDAPARRRTAVRPRDVLALARPAFWPVSLVPFHVGFVLATHRLVPQPDELARVLAGGVVVGPLLWLAVLAVNDAHDVAADRLNPRKCGAPLTVGRTTPETALRVAAAASGLALAVAVLAGPVFAVGTGLMLLLGWAYSAPPVRLKGRAGLDVLANAAAVGVVGPLAGWSVVARPAAFPWVIAVQGALVGAALYLPTTVADRASDLAAGCRTVAVHLGADRAQRLGQALWLAAAGWSVLLSATGTVLPRSMLPVQVVLVPALVWAYPRLTGLAGTFRGIVVLAVLFLVPCSVFLTSYVGA